MSPQQKLQKQRDALDKRLSKAQTRLAQAESEGSEQLEAFSNAVATLNEKIKATDLELSTFTQTSQPATEQAEQNEENS